MHQNILGNNFLILIAHPDDESFLAAGIMHENKIRGGKNFVICASKGELGYSYLDSSCPVEEIKRIREQELLSSSKYIGVDVIKILDFPDGSIHLHVKKLEEKIMKFSSYQKFDYVISFGEDGYTGHTDHIALSRIAKNLANLHKVPLIEFAKLPKNVCGDMKRYLIVKRRNGKYSDIKAGKESNLKVKIDPFVKLKSLVLHKSQFTGLNPYKIFPLKIAEHFLHNEYFYVSKANFDQRRFLR